MLISINRNGRTFRIGDVVRHFKSETIDLEGNTEFHYVITGFAKHSETGEILVTYRALYGQHDLCARPVDMFFSEVDRNKYPNIEQKHRLERVCSVSELIHMAEAGVSDIAMNNLLQEFMNGLGEVTI